MIPTPPFQSVASPLSDGKQPGPIGASPADEAQAAPFHELRGKSSQRAASLAGIGVPMADCPASFLSDDPWLAAWRESQGQPIDAEPRRA